MTLPSLIQKYDEQATVNKVKKFYSVFSQAYTQAILDNGTIDNWGLTDSELEEDDEGNMDHSEESNKNYDRFLTIMSKYIKSVKYEKLVGQYQEETAGFVMPDGTRITGMWLEPSNCINDYSYCGDIYITVKGKKREKIGDKFGKYTFAFIINRNRIFPVGTDDSKFKNYCLNGENYSRCTGWVILNGNMDYLHCNDLSFNGKTKCK